MNRINTVLILFFLASSLAISQKISKDSIFKKTNAIAFTVNASGATDAWDDPDTDPDESMDGICADSNGQCTITAAAQEATNMNSPVIITFASSLTIALDIGPPLLSGSKILGEGKNITIAFSTAGMIEFEDNNEMNGITIEHGGVGMVNNNIIKGCTIKSSIQSAVPISITGANNIIGGLNPSDRNIIIGGAVSGIGIGMDATMIGGFNQIRGNYIGVDATGATANGNIVGIMIQGERGKYY